MKKLKVANLVLNNFTSDNRVYKTAKSLTDFGYSVTIIALLKGDVKAKDEIDGIPIERIELKTMALPEGTLWGAIKYLEIIWKMVFRYRKYDIWHCNDFEIFFMGVLAKMTRPKLKLVYDSHEYQSERYGKAGIEKKFISRMEKLTIHKAEAFITVSAGIAEEYKRRFGVKAPCLVYNSPHYTVVSKSSVLRDKFGIPSSSKIFLYQGGLAVSRGMELLLETFERMNDPSLHLVMMGSGKFQPLVEKIAGRSDVVHFHPSVPYHDLIQYTASVDVGIISTQNLCLNNWFCMPNKLFEYIQAEIPVLTNNLHDCRQIVREWKIGEVIPEYTTEDLEKSVREMARKDLSQYSDGLKKAKLNFQWNTEEKKLKEIYAKLAAQFN
ncbi:MAG: glycosyltransferase involved in cell wall biosynthesis [Flavobacteriales bacterium]|jgi:glycosyltransferase involved in cell wall biosynthesis